MRDIFKVGHNAHNGIVSVHLCDVALWYFRLIRCANQTIKLIKPCLNRRKRLTVGEKIAMKKQDIEVRPRDRGKPFPASRGSLGIINLIHIVCRSAISVYQVGLVKRTWRTPTPSSASLFFLLLCFHSDGRHAFHCIIDQSSCFRYDRV